MPPSVGRVCWETGRRAARGTSRMWIASPVACTAPVVEFMSSGTDRFSNASPPGMSGPAAATTDTFGVRQRHVGEHVLAQPLGMVDDAVEHGLEVGA